LSVTILKLRHRHVVEIDGFSSLLADFDRRAGIYLFPGVGIAQELGLHEHFRIRGCLKRCTLVSRLPSLICKPTKISDKMTPTAAITSAIDAHFVNCSLFMACAEKLAV
jgi:hypothetical protein